ncbi:hypothetical protein F3I62_03505 [Pseudomonas sp. R-28-1W-6]|uniref:DUF5681 domain-containing protein n=1 Tax=Pseudomonas sp. R-28-1W-6 TaxID=2650101 RepID=UPI0013656FE7|nr:DUF5681 domain-containing protein [Pseudomonas sp. R-28-1W-6]MWV11154.1 hypothetical protein [Pseudomonas sp. R-28-1W-6]
MKMPPCKLKPEKLTQEKQAEPVAMPSEPIRSPSGKIQDPKSGRFLPGNAGGGGRPKGSRNKVTIACEELLEGEGEKLTRKAIDLAMSGDTTALKICIDRIIPTRKGRPLPKLERKEGENPVETLLRAVLDGHVTPEEGRDVVSMVESAARVAATQILSDMRQQQMQAIKKATDSGAIPGGVMIVPLGGSLDDWENAAIGAQNNLKTTVKE